jgi:sulfoacetaldehyde dehydrogenase
MNAQAVAAAPADDREVVTGLVDRARAAMAAVADADQATVDDAVTALAWAVYEPGRARALAEMAVDETGLGNVVDKVEKNRRKTFGTLRDLLRAKSVGVIEEDPARGLVKYAKPVGVVAAVCPSTNPAATPVNKAMMAVKGRNAIVVATSPGALATTGHAVLLMRAELERAGHPPDLVQLLPGPVSKARTDLLMDACDLVVVTGSANAVRRAYRSGTPAIGVAVGNVPVIVDASADLDAAAARIAVSKTFDNATSCSSENALVVLDEVYEPALAALLRAGGYRASPADKDRIVAGLWREGRLNRELIAKDTGVFSAAVGLPSAAAGARFFLVEETGVGPAFPLSGEKLSPVLTVYRAADFEAALARVREILAYQGRGHSCGIHTSDMAHARRLAEETDVVRVLVNQAHCIGNGGAFDNGLDFTLSLCGGTWAGNSVSENLNYRHFLNVTHLSVPIPEDRPAEDSLFGAYLSRHGA